MSISEIPPVKITYSTARDICDDIWAGSIHCAKETGFSLHPMVTTVLWSGLLLAIRKELDLHGLIPEVQKRFSSSFAYVYDIGSEEAGLKADMQNRMQTFYEVIAEDLADLESERKIFDFVSIAINVNSQFSAGEEISLVKAVQIFQKTASLLSSHIYGILREINNGILLRFPNPRLVLCPPAPPEITPPQPAECHAPAPAPATHTVASYIRTLSPVQCFAAVIGVIAIVLIICILVAGGTGGSASTPTPTQPATTPLPEKPRPPSGTILAGRETGDSYIEVTASKSQDCVVTIKTADRVTKVAFFVRADSTVTVNVPAGDYYVYFAAGSTWYGYSSDGMFGTDTSYSMDDELRDFTNYTWTYTLYPVSNGNFSETPISKEEFWFG